MATMRFGEVDHQPEVLDAVAGKTATTTEGDECPACGSTNFSTVPHQERRDGKEVTVLHKVCLGCRHLLDD